MNAKDWFEVLRTVTCLVFPHAVCSANFTTREFSIYNGKKEYFIEFYFAKNVNLPFVKKKRLAVIKR